MPACRHLFPIFAAAFFQADGFGSHERFSSEKITALVEKKIKKKIINSS
ncbi:hypothetical protein B4096_3326 [Heyndrickxia coagulans]|nr:hypothetical protein B4096_3326 [Heyndrickxia coagulans]